MAYSDFTIDRLSTDFGVKFQEARFFAQIPDIQPSAWLTETLELAACMGFGSDKARAERLVSPVLGELARRNNYEFAIISGRTMDADPTRGLTGEIGFVLSFTRIQDFIQAPVFCVAAAEKQDVDSACARCAAQVIGAACLNERDRQPSSSLYGCYTTGVEWLFLRFENNLVTLDGYRYYINRVAELLGVLQHIVDQTRPRA